MATRDEARNARADAFRCLECSALSWFKTGETLRAARPRCQACGSIVLDYVKTVGKVRAALRRPRSLRAQLQHGLISQDEFNRRQTKYLQNQHQDYLARKKHGLLRPPPQR